MSTEETAGFKLSLQQERAWLQQDTAGVAMSTCIWRIAGPLAVDRLRSALLSVIARHEILRTVFHHHTGIKLPFQVIQKDPTVDWESAEASTTVDLEHGPLVQAQLNRIGPDRHSLTLRVPTVLADAFSLQRAGAELAQAYANRGGHDEVLQYADFVEWQSELLAGEDTKAGRDYWRDYCRGLNFAAPVSLPLERAVTAGRYAPQVQTLTLSLERLAQLEALASQNEVTSAALLNACWAQMLCRLIGKSELMLGTEVDGRKYDELDDAVGLFAKLLPLLIVGAPELSLMTCAKRLRASLDAAAAWEESFTWHQVPIADGLGGPFLPFHFAYHELPAEERVGDLSWRLLSVHAPLERGTLGLSVERSSEGVELRFQYDAARLSAESVRAWSGYFQTLLEAALKDPDGPVGRLPLLSPSEQRRQSVEWNQTASEYPKACVHTLFEAQAARTPERLALRVGEQTLTYQALNEQANQLAHHLRSLGVGPDALVGLALERSVELMVALLAILKAGGAYLPLNPDTPRPRLAQQLGGVRVVLSEQALSAKLPDWAGPTLCLDRDSTRWSGEPRINPTLTTTPEHLVYVLYTSGSTGVPKGVAVRHRNLVNYAHSIAEHLKLDQYPEGLHFASVSTIGADLGNTCIFPALLSGGCLHIIGFEESTDAQRFARHGALYPIDVLKIVPSHLRALLSAAEGRQILPHRALILGGEAFSPALLEQIRALNAPCELYNHYGPTETTVGSLLFKIPEDAAQRYPSATLPIGRPLANTQVYLLDPLGQIVPPGVSGELYIAGAGVTAGYLNQPERTAERFVPNPFATDPSARMYRTGDLARYWPDGAVEFLGRADDQVKIRGFRIELGDIEATLMQHPALKQALLLAREDERGEKRLIAYVLLKAEPVATSEDLRSYLKGQLPDYMVPAALIVLPRFPLTPNGKIDRAALPAPEALEAKAPYVAPSTPTEQAIASIWEELLRRPHLSVHANFFELGGHSLLATQVVSRIRRQLEVELPLRQLFESPTVAGLAQQIDSLQRGAAAQLPPITPIARDQDLPLSFAQQRLWVLDQIEHGNALYNIARSLHLQGPLNVEALHRALNEIVRRHESQRTTFGTRDAQPVQIIAPRLDLALPLEDLTATPLADPEALARQRAAHEAAQPFDLAHGPLIRARLLRLGPTDHVLLLTMHHIVSDAWSAGVFFQELGALYEAFAAGKPSPLPALAIQYADYAAWQRQWLQGPVLQTQLAYWRRQLEGAPPLLKLPTDRARPDRQSYQGAHEAIALSPSLAALIKDSARREGVTLFMYLLAGFQALLARLSSQDQIVIGTDLANRPTIECEQLIGFFINLLAIRTDLSGNPTFRDLLARVRETALGAYAHQDMPFDKLVEELQPERSLGHNPIVQVLFVMQNIPPVRRELAGMTVAPFDAPLTRSKFDIGVFVVDNDQGLTGHWVYSTDLFDAASIRRFASAFETLLTHATAMPETRLNALETLSAAARQQRGTETAQRKQSQLKKLMAAEPKAVTLPPMPSDGAS